MSSSTLLGRAATPLSLPKVPAEARLCSYVHRSPSIRKRTPAQQGSSLPHGPSRPVAALAEASATTILRPASQIKRLQEELFSRTRSAVQIMEEYVERLIAAEPHVGSFLHFARDDALRQARDVDRLLSEGRDAELGPLAGVPAAAKDNLCTSDMPSTGGSQILRGFQPPYDATAVARLRAAGAIILGKTNMDEFGMGSSTESSGYKVSSNPWDLERVPGGSSGGSGAAVASQQCVAALGSDTGGSIRQPASFCGVVGLKPTYGRVSRFGLMAYASSLDVVGCLAASVEDAALILGSIAGHDPQDATSSSRDVADYTTKLRPMEDYVELPLRGLRFGLVAETLGEGVDTEVAGLVRDAAAHLESLGATVNEVSLPTFASGLPAYYVLAPSEASSNLARYDGLRYGPRGDAEELLSLYQNSRGSGFGPEVKRRILMGTYALSAGYYDAFYKRAQQVRTLIQRDFARALQDNHALLTPTAPTPAFRKGDKTSDPLALYAGDLMTVNVNLAGLPAVTLPCGLAPGGPRGLPVGLQIIGPAFSEVELLQYAHVFEQTTPSWQHATPHLQIS